MKMKLMLITGLMLAAVGCSSVMPEPEPEAVVVEQVTVVENPSSKEMTVVPAQTTNETVAPSSMPKTQMEMPSTEVLEKVKDKVPTKTVM